MTFPLHALRAATLLALGCALLPAHATNGYFPHGFGTKSKGMGGAGIALAQDAFAGANNPAQAAFAGNRIETGLELFMPDRDMSRSFGGTQITSAVSGREYFLIPEFGYNVALSKRLGVGLTVFGNGGMNTTFPGGTSDCSGLMAGASPTSNALCGMGTLGVDLIQLTVAPTLAYQFSEGHALGVSPLFVYQQFKATGLQAFQMLPGASNDPTKLTNNGRDSSTGVGVRLGYMGQLTEQLSLGASYSPQISMSRFKDYAGLFADAGKFDIPENYGVGVAFQPTSSLQIALDYNRINYSQVPSIGNPAGFNMGAPNGGGFGWRNVEVFKLGMQWKMNPKTTLRVGVNRGTNPLTSTNITPGILAPGVMQTHFTLGGTYAMSPTSELSWHYLHAPRVSVTGPSLFNGLLPAGSPLVQESVSMRQNAIGVQWGMRF